MENDEELEKPLFIYGLISRFINKDNKTARQHEIQSISKENLEIPGSTKNNLTGKTLLNYVRRYESSGFQGLKRKVRSDKGKSKKLDEKVLMKIKFLKTEDPSRSTRQIIRILSSNQEFKDFRLSERTISRYLKCNGLTRKNIGKKRINFAFENDHINDLWQSDITDGITIRGSEKMTYLFAFIDDYSRIIPHAQFYYDEKLPRLEDTLKKAILKRGIPKTIYVDNGKVFDSKQFRTICAELKIQLLHHKPYSPQSKGKIERFFQRIQKEFMNEARFADISSLEELNSFLQTWIEIEYHRKEHQAIGSTPLDRYLNDLKAVKLRTVESLEEITEIFLYRENRKIHPSDGGLKFNGNIYQVNNQALLGSFVEVRFDPFNMEKVFIYVDGKYSETAYPRNIKNRVYHNIPEENKKEISTIRQSSSEYFTRLKEKELELSQKEKQTIDFSRLNKGVLND